MQGLHTIIPSKCYKLLLHKAKDKQNPLLQKNIILRRFFQLFPKNIAILSIFWSKFLHKTVFLNDCNVVRFVFKACTQVFIPPLLGLRTLYFRTLYSSSKPALRTLYFTCYPYYATVCKILYSILN